MIVLALLGGCFPEVAFDDTGAVGVALDSVAPAEGSNGGGLEFTVTGGPFDGDAEVWLGPDQAEVTGVAEDHIDALVPQAPDAIGPVAVRVRSSAGEAVLQDGFRFWEDAAGKADALVLLYEIRPAEAWAEPLWAPVVEARAVQVVPTDASPRDLLVDELGACAIASDVPPRVTGPDLFEIDGSTEFDVPWDDAESAYFLSMAGDEAPRVAGGTFSVAAAAAAWPALSASDALSVPAPPVVKAPDFGASDTPVADVSEGLAVSWLAGGTDWVWIALMDTTNGAYLWCAAEDTGSFVVPAEDLVILDWAPSDEDGSKDAESAGVMLNVLLMQDRATPLGFNGGELRATGGAGASRLVRLERAIGLGG